MKKHKILLSLSSSLSICLLLTSCGNTYSSNAVLGSTEQQINTSQYSNSAIENKMLIDEYENPEPTTICTLPLKPESTTVDQGGPYGKLSLTIPDGWIYETCPMHDEKLQNGLYGICFYPKGIKDGGIELSYINSFGVCGVGLNEETVTIAEHPANIGTYDNHTYWDFISFQDDYSGIVAFTYNVESWWETYAEQVLDILNTLTYDPSIKEGSTYIYAPESEADKIGLQFTLEKISSTGATLIFHQYEEKAPTGELQYGDAFVMEVLKNNQWEEVPVTLEGNYGFHQVAYTIPKQDSTKQELNWKWLYGTLPPGNYRIKKEIMDFRGSGDFDQYTVYAQFLLN